MVDTTQKTFAELVAGQVAAIQARAAGLVDFTVGSVLRAIVEAVSQVALWLEGMILILLSTTRAATSAGADLDSWMADYGLERLPATAAAGNVTFSRFSTGSQAVIPIGATLQIADGSQGFIVVLDAANPAYNSGLGGYVIEIGAASVTVRAQAQTAGAAGNVVSSSITVMTTAIAFVDTVTNSSAFSGGADAESDTALRIRFVAYIESLTEGTKAAVVNAVQALSTTAIAVVVENMTYAGAAQYGFFYVIADDGTGAPTTDFLAQASSAVEAVRPLTSTFQVYAPVVVTANVALSLTVASGYVGSTVSDDVEAAITTYIQGLAQQRRADPTLSTLTLSYTRLIQIAYDASPGVAGVSALLINGATADVVATAKQTIKAGTVVATAL